MASLKTLLRQKRKKQRKRKRLGNTPAGRRVKRRIGKLNKAIQKKRRQGKIFRGRSEPAYVFAQRFADKFNLRITSGYRSPAHNRAVGGAPNSYHVRGLAFDFVPARGGAWGRLDRAKAWAYARFSRRFNEVIWRAPGHYDHLHVAFKSPPANPSQRSF